MALWTVEEIQTAQQLYASGLTWRQVGEYLGKSKNACINAVARYEGKQYEPRNFYAVGPAIGLEKTEIAYRKDCKIGSTVLYGLIKDLLNRMSPEEVAEVLGTAPTVEPGQERIYRGQLAERALAA